MSGIPYKTEQRINKRLKLALPVSLLDHKGESKDISSNGVYLSLQTDDIDRFFPGKEGRVDINVRVNSTGLPDKMVWLSSVGAIVRTEIKDTIGHTVELGIALKFNEKLRIEPCK